MNTPEAAVLSSMSSLCAPLNDCLSTAAERAADARRRLGIGHSSHDWAGAHMIRATAHELLLARRDELREWSASPRRRNNGPLWLTRGSATIRVLHSDGPIPIPGRNRSRRAFFTQESLLEGLDDADHFRVVNGRFLALWQVADAETHEVAIRIVRPHGTWKYGEKSKVDLSFWLPSTSAEFEALHFEPSDHDIELVLPGDEDADHALGG